MHALNFYFFILSIPTSSIYPLSAKTTDRFDHDLVAYQHLHMDTKLNLQVEQEQDILFHIFRTYPFRSISFSNPDLTALTVISSFRANSSRGARVGRVTEVEKPQCNHLADPGSAHPPTQPS
jgi:hypothetical protein